MARKAPGNLESSQTCCLSSLKIQLKKALDIEKKIEEVIIEGLKENQNIERKFEDLSQTCSDQHQELEQTKQRQTIELSTLVEKKQSLKTEAKNEVEEHTQSVNYRFARLQGNSEYLPPAAIQALQQKIEVQTLQQKIEVQTLTEEIGSLSEISHLSVHFPSAPPAPSSPTTHNPECPVCMEDFSGRQIFSCRGCDGLLCSACVPQLTRCPLCRINFGPSNQPIRNKAVERILLND